MMKLSLPWQPSIPAVGENLLRITGIEVRVNFFLNLAHLSKEIPQNMPEVWPSEVREVRHYCGIVHRCTQS